MKAAVSVAKREETRVKRSWTGGVPIEIILVALTALGCLAAMFLRLEG